MSAPNPTLYETATTTPLAPWDFGEQGPLDVSAEHDFDLANVGAAAEDLTELSLGVEESDDSGATWHQEGEVCLERWVQLQAYDVDGDDIEAQTTPWTPVGVGARLYLKTIPAEARRLLRARVVMPAGFSSASKQVRLVVYWREGYVPLGHGLFEAGIRGVVGGTGDPEFSALVSGGALTATGTPDGNVQIADLVAKVAGAPVVRYAGAEAIAASAAGLARWVALSVAADGTITETASSEVTAPAPVSDRPAKPATEPLLGYVHRDDGTIASGDIYADAAAGVRRSPFALTLDGLDATIGPGRAVVDNRLVFLDKDTPLTLEDDQESIIYVQPDSSMAAVEVGTTPDWPRALAVWSVTVAGGVVTATRDLRNFLGPRVHTFEAFFTGAAVDDAAIYWTAPIGPRLYVKVPRGVTLSAGTIGDRTAGALHVPLEYWDGAAWTSLFSSTSKDPQLAFNATVLAVGGFLPDTVEVPAGTRLRFRQETTSLTGGTTNPSNVYARADFEEFGP